MRRLLALAAAAALVGLARVPAGPPLARLAVVTASMWLLPGALLARLRGGAGGEAAPELAFAFAGSAAWLALAAAVCFALRLPPAGITYLTAALLAALALVPAARGAAGQPGAAGASLVQLTGLLALAVLLVRCGGTIGQSFDSLDHLAYLKSILRDQSVLPVREFYREVTSRAIDLRKGFLHAPLAETVRLANMPAADVWRLWPGFVGPCVTACFYVLARAFSGGRGAALVCTALFAAVFGGPGRAFFLKVGYPNKTADALVWLAWAAAAGSLRRGAPRGPFPAPLLLCGSALIHVFAAAPWFFGWGTFSVLALLVRRARPAAAGAWRLLAASVAACAPVLVWRFIVSYHPINPMHTALEGFLYLPHGYVVEPLSWVATTGSATWLAVLLSPWLIAADPAPHRLALCAALWAAVALLFNPLLVPLVAPRLGYLLIRLFPSALAVCAVGMWLFEQARRLARGPARGPAAAWLALLAVAVGPDVRAAFAGYGPAAMEVERDHSAARWAESVAFLQQHYRLPVVVASDPMTLYGLAGLTRHDVIATLNQHSSPSDSEALERMQAALDIQSPGADPARTAAALRRYDVEVVVVNHTYEHPLLDYMATLDPADYPAIEAKFRAHPEVFREVFRAPGQWIYEVNRDALNAYAQLPGRDWPAEAAPEGARTVDLGGGTLLDGTQLLPGSTPAGSEVQLRAWLRRTGPLPPGDKLTAVISLSRPVERPQTWLPPRWQRLAAQRRDHRLYRLNYYLPVTSAGGGPEYWPLGTRVRSEFQLHVPTGARPGVYRLRVRVVPERFSPDVDLRYYLQDDDATPGGVLDSLRVGPPAAPAPGEGPSRG